MAKDKHQEHFEPEVKPGGKFSFGLIELTPVFAVAASLLVGSLLIVISGENPVYIYAQLLNGAFGSPRRIAETFVRFTPLLLGGLGIAVAFKTSTWNVGGPGQIYMGALGSTVVGIYLVGLPIFIHLPLVIIAGFALGGLWGFIPAVLKTQFKMNDVVTTVMLNYIAIYVVDFLMDGPLREPGAMIPWTSPIQPSARLPVLFYRLHAGFLLAIIGVPLIYFLLKRTVIGFEMRATGLNAEAAKHSGINASRSVWLAMFISGGLLGLAGTSEICGVFYRLQQGFSSGYGYAAITVALLGNLEPFTIIFSALLFGTLATGTERVRYISNIPTTLADALQGTILIFLLVGNYFSRRRKLQLLVQEEK